MSKKIFFTITIVIALFLCSPYTFALTNEISQGMNDAGTEMKDSWNKMR